MKIKSVIKMLLLGAFLIFPIVASTTACTAKYGKKHQKIRRGKPIPCPIKDC